MKVFVTVYYDLFFNTMEIKQIKAKDIQEALKQSFLYSLGDEKDFNEHILSFSSSLEETLENIKQYAFDQEIGFGIKEITLD